MFLLLFFNRTKAIYFSRALVIIIEAVTEGLMTKRTNGIRERSTFH